MPRAGQREPASGAARASGAAIVLLATGCATQGGSDAGANSLREKLQPVDLRLTVSQPDLYAAYETSTIHDLTLVSACMLSVATCWLGPSIASAFEASGIRRQDETVQPLKTAIADIDFPVRETDAMSSAFAATGTRLSGITVERVPGEKNNEETFERSTAGSVIYVTIDYHATEDFSRFEIEARGLAFARSPAARRAVGQSEDLVDDQIRGAPLSEKNSILRSTVRYVVALEHADAKSEVNAGTWTRDGGNMMRAAMLDGIAQVAMGVAYDFGTAPWPGGPALVTGKLSDGRKGKVVADDGAAGRLLRLEDGSLHYESSLGRTAPAPVAPAAISPASP